MRTRGIAVVVLALLAGLAAPADATMQRRADAVEWGLAADGSVVFRPVDFTTNHEGVRFTDVRNGDLLVVGVTHSLPRASTEFRWRPADGVPLQAGDRLVAEGTTSVGAPFRFSYEHQRTPTVVERSVPSADHRLIWATTQNGSSRGRLDGATVHGRFDVRLRIDGDVAVERVEWYLDGRLYRDDDVRAPYNIRYTDETVPLDRPFTSDQDGIVGEWILPDGSSHDVRAVVHPVDDPPFAVEARFDVAAGESSPAKSTPPTGDDRPVVPADGDTVLDQPHTIYDFGFGEPGEVVILASNVEARNIRGPGARRIGARDGRSITDSGFRDFEFTFVNIRMSDGATITRPYFIDGVDVNGQPHTGSGDIIQIFAYQGAIRDPLIENVTVFGKRRPRGSSSHNDAIQFTGIDGGEVWNPTIRDSWIEGASSAAIQAKHVHGLFTIEGNALSERFGSFHAVIAKPGDREATILWRDNELLDGASAAFTDGWRTHSDSDGTVAIG